MKKKIFFKKVYQKSKPVYEFTGIEERKKERKKKRCSGQEGRTIGTIIGRTTPTM